MMVWMIAIFAVAVLGLAAMAAHGRFGSMATVDDDDPVPALPAKGKLTADHIRDAKFSLAWRGYKQDQVDALLARVAGEMPQTSASTAKTETLKPGVSVAVAPAEEKKAEDSMAAQQAPVKNGE